jgi:hypothetical protein
MSINEIKKLVLDNPHGGLFVYHYEIESSNERRFLYLLDGDVATVSHNSKVFERKFTHGELLKYLDSRSFWSLNDFEYDKVFDGCEYLIMFKNREGNSKLLHLLNPEYSESKDIQKLISLIESEVLNEI